MNHNLVQDAKNKIYNSELMLYINPEKIEEAFKKIHVYTNKEEFISAYGNNYDDYGILEGFNRNGESYIGPDATAHTVIHEVMHTISSKFDNNGHRTINGISGNREKGFGIQINEGMTDYLASKISGEDPRHYIEGHKLFAKLEPMMIKYTKDSNIFMQIYINNDVKFIQDFLNYFGKENTFEELYDRFLYKDDKEIDKLLKPVEKNVNRYVKKVERKEKLTNILDKVKNIFSRNKVKMLTEGKQDNIQQINSHEQFVNDYNINNFKTNMTEKDEEMYMIYNNKNKDKQQENSNESFKDL